MGILILLSFLVGLGVIAFKYYMLKKQMRSLLNQQKASDESFLYLQFVDRDLEKIVLLINQRLEENRRVWSTSEKKAGELKASIEEIAHDMRTPLTSVIGYLQLAQRECKNAEEAQNLSIALERAEYCSKLVHDFYEISVVDTKPMMAKLEKVDLSRMLCEEILAAYPQFSKNNIIPEFGQSEQSVYVSADSDMLKRVLQNLIENSIRYSAGTVQFSIQRKTQVILMVRNSVINEKIDCDMMFEKFYSQKCKNGQNGTGIGLYLCKCFTESMGGTIRAECESDCLNTYLTLNPYLE